MEFKILSDPGWFFLYFLTSIARTHALRFACQVPVAGILTTSSAFASRTTFRHQEEEYGSKSILGGLSLR
jgi:hypothetical protein